MRKNLTVADLETITELRKVFPSSHTSAYRISIMLGFEPERPKKIVRDEDFNESIKQFINE